MSPRRARTLCSVATVRRPVPCSRVTYYGMLALSSRSRATYKRFLHLASQVSTKYTLEFSRKERLVRVRGFVEIFPLAAFLALLLLCFLFFLCLSRSLRYKRDGALCHIALDRQSKEKSEHTDCMNDT